MTETHHRQVEPGNVIALPPPMPKTVAPEAAGPFTFPIVAYTDVIGGTYMDTHYRKEVVMIDPDAELEDDCLVVTMFHQGSPFMHTFWRTGRDESGRFVPAGDPREAFSLDGIRCSFEHLDRYTKILGRVVGPPRRLMRSCASVERSLPERRS